MNRNGFTLVEMMMVVGIVSMTAAAAAPSLIGRAPHRKVQEASWQIYMDLQQAKARSVSENRPVEITVNNSLDKYTIWVDTNGNGIKETSETQVKDLSGISGVNLDAYPTTARFNPSGTLTTNSYYFYMRVYVNGAGYKYIYVFPNGHIDPMRIQSS